MYLLTRARHLPAAGGTARGAARGTAAGAVACGAAAVLVLGPAGPAAALAPAPGAPPGAAPVASPPVGPATGLTAGSAAEDDGSTPGEGLTLTPATGRGGASIAVSALCASETDHATVSSPAFAHPVALHQSEGGAARAQATVRSGLIPGKSYVVTANCSETESLTSSFVHIGGPGTRTAAAGGGSPRQENGVGNAALAFGGGLATAGLAGYLLTVRRTSAGRNRRRPAERRPAERATAEPGTSDEPTERASAEGAPAERAPAEPAESR